MFTMLRSTTARRTALLLLLCIALTASFLPTAAFAAPEAVPAASGSYHRVKAGETLSEIARYYGVTINALKSANGLSNANYIYVGQRLYIPSGDYSAPVGCSSYYLVRPGDKLSIIAARLGINTNALASANGLSNANYIYVGQRLCIPSVYGDGGHPHNDGGHPHNDGGYGEGYYKVKAGDTLSEIAAWNHTSVHKLMGLNGLSNPNYIYIGQMLRLF